MRWFTLLIVVLSSAVSAAEYEAWLGVEHITDDQDAVQLGLTIEWEHWELDLSHGIKRMKWRTIGEPEWQMDEWQSGSISALRWYPFNNQTIRPMLIWSHSSDIGRGKPFNNINEPTSDFFGVGASIQVKWVEIQLAYGRDGRECQIVRCSSGSSTNEALIQVRGNFWSSK